MYDGFDGGDDSPSEREAKHLRSALEIVQAQRDAALDQLVKITAAFDMLFDDAIDFASRSAPEGGASVLVVGLTELAASLPDPPTRRQKRTWRRRYSRARHTKSSLRRVIENYMRPPLGHAIGVHDDPSTVWPRLTRAPWRRP